MSETKHTCGECFHFDACRKMMESVLDSQWNLSSAFLETRPSCQDFIEASLVMSAFRAAERQKGPAKSQKKCVTIKLSISEAMNLRSMVGDRVDKIYNSISISEYEGVVVPSWLEADLKEKSGISGKIVQAIDDYYR